MKETLNLYGIFFGNIEYIFIGAQIAKTIVEQAKSQVDCNFGPRYTTFHSCSSTASAATLASQQNVIRIRKKLKFSDKKFYTIIDDNVWSVKTSDLGTFKLITVYFLDAPRFVSDETEKRLAEPSKPVMPFPR